MIKGNSSSWAKVAARGIPDRTKRHNASMDSFEGIDEPSFDENEEIKKTCQKQTVLAYVRNKDATSCSQIQENRGFISASDLMKIVKEQAKWPQHLHLNEVETVQSWT